MNNAGPSIIWAAIPMELVTEGLEPPWPDLVEVAVEGRTVLATAGENGYGLVQRLISGDPQDYLDPRWQPGARIRLS